MNLIVTCARNLELEKIAEFNPLEGKIAEKFWPGPITLILKIKDKEIQKSLDLEGKIAVRVPNNQCVLALLKKCKQFENFMQGCRYTNSI